MIQLEQQPKPEEAINGYTEIQKRTLRYALYHFQQIDLRMRVGLQNLGFFDTSDEAFGKGIDAEVLLDQDYPRRIKLPPGPVLLYVTAETASSSVLIDVPPLLLSELWDVRSGALKHLEDSVADFGLKITPKTRSELDRFRDAILSQKPEVWRPAAIAVSDAFNNDALVAIQAVHQALVSQPILKETLDHYGPKMLFPDFTAVDSIDIGMRCPEVEHAAYSDKIAMIIENASNLGDACAKYYNTIGFIPLAPPFDLATVVSGWLSRHPDEDVWTQVWQWAYEASSPVPRYHAVTVFVHHPDFIPTDKYNALWDEIMSVVCATTVDSSDQNERVTWDLRRDLMLHYTRHLEAQMTGAAGAGVCLFAWWLTEQVANILPTNEESLHFYHEKWVLPALERSSHVWISSNPNVASARLRYITHNIQAPWACSLFAVMGSTLDKLQPSNLSDEKQASFGQALFSCLLSMLPYQNFASAVASYAIECNIGETVDRWNAILQNNVEVDNLKQLGAFSKMLGTTEGLCQNLKVLDEKTFVDQFAVVMALRSVAFREPQIAKDLWPILAENEWSKRVMLKIDSKIFAMLIDVFASFIVQQQKDWVWNLPHYLAKLIEEEYDEKRLRELFLSVIHVSLSSDSVSAVQRLLRGPKKVILAPWAQEYREQINATYAWYPPWVQSRMRALLASLHV